MKLIKNHSDKRVGKTLALMPERTLLKCTYCSNSKFIGSLVIKYKDECFILTNEYDSKMALSPSYSYELSENNLYEVVKKGTKLTFEV